MKTGGNWGCKICARDHMHCYALTRLRPLRSRQEGVKHSNILSWNVITDFRRHPFHFAPPLQLAMTRFLYWVLWADSSIQTSQSNLKLQSLTLLLLVTTQLEVLTSLQSQLSLGLAVDTLQSQNDLLGGLGLLVENWLGLTTETRLLTVVSSLTLGEQGSLTSLVLGNLVLGVLLAQLTLTVSLSELWNVNLMLVLEQLRAMVAIWAANSLFSSIFHDWSFVDRTL